MANLPNIKMKKIPLHLNIVRSQDSHPISASSHPSTSPYHPSPKGPMMKPIQSHSELSATTSGRHFAPISPSYQTYHPEWTSVSPPALASSFNDHPEFYSAPPRKKLCHLLNPTFRSASSSSAQDVPALHPSSTPSSATTAPNTCSSNLRSPPQVHQQGSCSVSPDDAHASSHHQFSDDHEHEPYKYPALTHSQPMLADEDRATSSRPLKNTKRAAQNRAAQRAFRERKDRYVRELEARSTQFEEYILRNGLLEERERLIAAREAKLTCHSGKPYSIPEVLSKGKLSAEMAEDRSIIYGSQTSENDKKDYIAKLEDQLENSRMEITRLRSELLKLSEQDEDMDKGHRRMSDWERGHEEGFIRPRTDSASDVETGGPASCSPGSPYAWSASKAMPQSHHHHEWVRDDRIMGDNGRKSYGEENGTGGFINNRNPTLTANIQRKGETVQSEESSRFGWSDGSRSPVSLSLSHQHKHSARVRDLSEDHDRMTRHHFPAPKLLSLDVPLRRANILDRQGKLVRLPAILHHLNQNCRDDEWKR